MVELLSSYMNEEREVWVELGLQSANNDTLARINRGHTVEDYIDAATRLHERNLKVCTHVIIGLPGETRKDYERTAEVLNECGSDAVKIHNLHIPGGTRMAEDYLSGEIAAFSTERYIRETENFLRRLNPNMVVERLLCETPSHRLMAPRHFLDKSQFLTALEERMILCDTRQGDLYEG